MNVKEWTGHEAVWVKEENQNNTKRRQTKVKMSSDGMGSVLRQITKDMQRRKR